MSDRAELTRAAEIHASVPHRVHAASRYQDRAPHAATADFAPLPGVAGGGGASARLPRRAVVRGSHMTDAHDAAPAARGRPGTTTRDDNIVDTTLYTETYTRTPGWCGGHDVALRLPRASPFGIGSSLDYQL